MLEGWSGGVVEGWGGGVVEGWGGGVADDFSTSFLMLVLTTKCLSRKLEPSKVNLI